MIPGVLKSDMAVMEESIFGTFGISSIHPPREYEGTAVPEVLISDTTS